MEGNMKQSIFQIVSNKCIADITYEMVLKGDCSDVTRPGQFVNLKLDGFFLRRPISVCDCQGDLLTIIYKVVGHGTEVMAQMQAGEEIDILTGLGNGYDLSKSTDNPVLIGGGAGVPPMYLLAKELIKNGKKPSVVLGFNKKSEVFYEDEFKALGLETVVATADGSYGVKGFVTDAMKALDYGYFFTCGPEPMLRAIYDNTTVSGQMSFEARMGCGFGACMGCTCETLYGNKRICKDGPVLVKEEVKWAD